MLHEGDHLVPRGKLQFLVQAVCFVCLETCACCAYLFYFVSTLHLNMGIRIAKILNSKCIVQGLA